MPRARHAPGLRRVLHRVRLGRPDARCRCCTPTSAAATLDGHPRRPLAVQALQPRRLPVRLRGRRPGAGRRAARRPQEPRPADARPRSSARWSPRWTTTSTSTSSTRATPPGARRLRDALEAAGFRIDHSEASLYLWATRDEDCWDTVAWLAERGILVAPGAFYGRGRRAARAGGLHRHRRADRRRRRPALGRLSPAPRVGVVGAHRRAGAEVPGRPSRECPDGGRITRADAGTRDPSVEDVDVHVVAVLEDRPVAA